MSTMKWFTALSLLAFAPLATGGCSAIECGDGTTEKDGFCVAADGKTPDVDSCGDGASYDSTLQKCVPDFPATQCDPDTTTPIVDDNGVVVCVGTGVTDCKITCKNPDAGKVTICGQLVNAQDSLKIESGGTGGKCDPDAPTTDGPCSIKLQFFDALQFAGNPSGAPELVPDELIVNDCGAYMGHNIPTPMLGFLAVAGDDHPSSGVDIWARSGAATAVVSGQRITGQNSYIVATSTDALWTANAGDPFSGQSFWQRGAYFPVFLGPDTSTTDPGDLAPVEGVTVLVSGSVVVGSDYYFTDTDPLLRTTPSDTQAATGVNGSAIVVDSDLVNHGGQGAEPTDTAVGQEGVACVWPEDLGAALPEVYFALERAADNSVTGENCE